MDSIRDRAQEVLLMYRFLQYSSDDATLERIQANLRFKRRNYNIVKALGKQWEHAINQEWLMPCDAKVEFVQHSYGRLRVMPPFQPRAFLAVDLESSIATVDMRKPIEIELKRWQLENERRLLAYNGQMNTLYIGK